MTYGKYGQENGVLLVDLYGGPAYRIRRAHQIATAVFAQACEELGLTHSQYAVLFALRQCGPVGQNELGRLVSLDRCTTSVVVGILSERGLTSRMEFPNDRRKVLLRLTTPGQRILARAERRSSSASTALLSVFSKNQARAFMDLLDKFNRAHDRQVLEPLRSRI
ncbi:MAG TPA: MarR family winged helix-turn-helix transcriptional regulator [Burkholderiaceae bacterium]|nr:MarR family winged helix-turn-helix transcriptional regulator [Burkholderiaceae bacterium]